MQSNIEIVKALFAAFDAGDAPSFGALLADDFKLIGISPQPLDKNGILDMLGILHAALPNSKRSLSDFHTDGDIVKVTMQLSGLHTGPLDLSSMGLGVIPATGKAINLAPEQRVYTIVAGKITQENDVTRPSPEAGMLGLLEALGMATSAG